MTTESTTGEGVVEASDMDMGGVDDSGGEEISDEGGEPSGDIEVSDEGSSEGIEEPSSDEPEPTFEVTIDGVTVSKTREELIKGFQLGAASHERFRQAAELKKSADSSLDSMMKNPIEAFLKAGGDEAALRDLTETYLYGKLQQDKMTPEERELAELKQYKVQQEQRQKEAAEAKQQELEAAQTQRYQDEYTANFNKAFESAGVASTPQAMSRVAQIQLSAMEAGYEMPLDSVVAQYKEEQMEHINSYLSSLDEDGISAVIGKDRMKAIRKKELAGAKNPKPRKTKNTPAATTASQEPISMADFFDNL